MSDELTDQRLDEIEALASKATPGPWVLNGDTAIVYESSGAGDEVCDCLASEREDEDGRFIAASRELVPQLVKEVRRLRLAVAQYQQGEAK